MAFVQVYFHMRDTLVGDTYVGHDDREQQHQIGDDGGDTDTGGDTNSRITSISITSSVIKADGVTDQCSHPARCRAPKASPAATPVVVAFPPSAGCDRV